MLKTNNHQRPWREIDRTEQQQQKIKIHKFKWLGEHIYFLLKLNLLVEKDERLIDKKESKPYINPYNS